MRRNRRIFRAETVNSIVSAVGIIGGVVVSCCAAGITQQNTGSRRPGGATTVWIKAGGEVSRIDTNDIVSRWKIIKEIVAVCIGYIEEYPVVRTVTKRTEVVGFVVVVGIQIKTDTHARGQV